MNLVSDPWIPVLPQGGESELLSLEDVFTKGSEARDLAVRPDERISLMRLFIAVAQAALQGPDSSEEWECCRERLPSAARNYLQNWRDAFELFGPGPRFLQVPQLSLPPEKWTPTSKLDFALATGNNSTLFDNSGGEIRSFPPHHIALRLLTFQCFSPGGLIGVAQWNGSPTPGNGSSEHAPCVAGSMAHAYIRGADLLETVCLNLLTRDQVHAVYGENGWGRPVWELQLQSPGDTATAQTVGNTYLGRLVPLSRAILLADDGSRMILANGFPCPSFDKGGPREVASTVIVREIRGKQQHVLLPLSQQRAIWRELHSVLVRQRSGASVGGPLALLNLPGDRPFDLWVGGMIVDQAKPLDLVESVFHIPAGMLDDTCLRVYETGVKKAQDVESALRNACQFLAQELSRPAAAPAVGIDLPNLRARILSLFWAGIDGSAADLMTVSASGALPQRWRDTVWGQTLYRVAMDAFTPCCPRATRRQLRASALAIDFLGAQLNTILP